MKKLIAMVLIVGLVGVSSRVGAAAEATGLPKGVLVAAEVSKFDDSLKNLQVFLNNMELAIPVPVMVLRTQVARLLKDPELKGLDLDRGLKLVLLNPKEYAVPVVLIVPLKSAQAYQAQLSQVATRAAGGAPVITYSEEVKEFDYEAFLRAPQEERADVAKFTKKTLKEFHVAFAGKLAALAQDRAACAAVHRLMAAGQITEAPMIRADVDAAASCDVGTLLKLYQGEIEDLVLSIGQMMQQVPGALPPGMEPEKMGELLTAMARWATGLGAEVNTTSLSLVVEPQDLKLRFEVDTVEGKPLANCLAKQQPTTMMLAPYIDTSAPMWMVMNNSNAKEFMEIYRPLIIAMLKLSKPGAEGERLAEQAVEQTLRQAKLLAGEGAMSLAFADGMSISVLYETTDPVQARAVEKEAMAAGGLMTQGMGFGMKMTYQKDAATHKGIPIDKFAMEMGEMMDQMPPEQREMMTKMYGGEGMSGYLAYVEKLRLQTMGKDALVRIKALIDKVQAPPPPRPEVLAELKGRFPGSVFVGVINYSTLMAQILSMAPMPGGPIRLQAPKSPGMPLGVRCTRTGDLVAEVHVPAKELAALQQIIMQIVQMQMAQPPERDAF